MAHSTTTESPADLSCLSCLGAGWKYVTRRWELHRSVVSCGSGRRLVRRACSECVGSGVWPAGLV